VVKHCVTFLVFARRSEEFEFLDFPQVYPFLHVFVAPNQDIFAYPPRQLAFASIFEGNGSFVIGGFYALDSVQPKEDVLVGLVTGLKLM
jgi:hypothetical protein